MLRPIKLKDKILEVPIIQGGMGIGVSLSNLASSVRKEGGMGVISAAMPGFNEPDFETNSLEANIRALKKEIQKANEVKHGLLGVNIMVASRNYESYVKASVEAGADAIISGAGLPLDLPKYAEDKIMLAPIVSSAKACRLLCRVWDKHHNTTPDFVIIEGQKAGGHLGFKKKDLEEGTYQMLEQILKEVLEELVPLKRNIINRFRFLLPVEYLHMKIFKTILIKALLVYRWQHVLLRQTNVMLMRILNR